MRKAFVYSKGILAGELIEDQSNYVFTYNLDYFKNDKLQAISLTLPKSQQEYRSQFLFPFFYNMISEGINKKLQSQSLKIDENDSFGLLLATAQFDTIGSITITPNE